MSEKLLESEIGELSNHIRRLDERLDPFSLPVPHANFKRTRNTDVPLSCEATEHASSASVAAIARMVLLCNSSDGDISEAVSGEVAISSEFGDIVVGAQQATK